MAEVTYLEAIRQGLREEMRRDENVFILGEDVGAYGGAFKVTEGFLARVRRAAGHRHADRGGGHRRRGRRRGAHGAAAGGGDAVHRLHLLRLRHAHQLRGDGALPGRAAHADGGARARPAGTCAAGRSTRRIPRRRSSTRPGLKIVCPATARDAKGLIKAAIRDDDPVLYFEHKYLYRRIKEDLPEGEEILTPIGKARVAREGSDLSIITWSAMVWKALEAAEQLDKEDGLSVEVLDLRTLLPMDDEAIVATVRKTNRVLIVHEDTRTGGVAGEITARINDQAFEWLDAPVRRVTAHDVPLPYAPTLEDFVLPQTDDLVLAAAAGWPPTRTSETGCAWPRSTSSCPRWASPSPRARCRRWIKKVGDAVKRDEPIFEISTDKVDAEIPAPPAGVLAEILVQEGQTVPVQTVVARSRPTRGAAAAAPAAGPAAAPAPRRRRLPRLPPAGRRRPPRRGRRPRRPHRRPPPPPRPAPAGAETAEERLRRKSHAAGPQDGRRAQPRHQRHPGQRASPAASPRTTCSATSRRRRRRAPPAPPLPPAPLRRRRAPPGARGADHACIEVPSPVVEPWPGDRVEPWSKIRKLTADHMIMSRRVSAHVQQPVRGGLHPRRAGARAHGRRSTPSAA